MRSLMEVQFEGLNLSQTVVCFFIYAFIGWAMECVVIRREKGYWENRGFAKMPFCIIYGFGAIAVYALLRPLENNLVLLYCVGAMIATMIEYVTAKVMIRLFGELWWDYSNKPLNYKGILCLESTLGWGLLTIFFFKFMNRFITGRVAMMPGRFVGAVAVILIISYLADFSVQFMHSLNKDKEMQKEIN